MIDVKSKSDRIIGGDVTWRDITPGGVISDPGTAEECLTGDWRSEAPVFIAEKCKQCLLCFPVCPDSSIPLDADGKRGDFDFDHCKGCMVCMEVCPFNAIEREEI